MRDRRTLRRPLSSFLLAQIFPLVLQALMPAGLWLRLAGRGCDGADGAIRWAGGASGRWHAAPTRRCERCPCWPEMLKRATSVFPHLRFIIKSDAGRRSSTIAAFCCNLVHLVHRGVDLLQPGRLFAGRCRIWRMRPLISTTCSAILCSAPPAAGEIDAFLDLAGRCDQVLISLAAVAERCASSRTSCATTAKPLPAHRHALLRRRHSTPRGWSGDRRYG